MILGFTTGFVLNFKNRIDTKLAIPKQPEMRPKPIALLHDALNRKIKGVQVQGLRVAQIIIFWLTKSHLGPSGGARGSLTMLSRVINGGG